MDTVTPNQRGANDSTQEEGRFIRQSRAEPRSALFTV
jgi:hypothetical protein